MNDGDIVQSMSPAASFSMLESFTMVMKRLLDLDTHGRIKQRTLSNSIDEYHVLRNDCLFECVFKSSESIGRQANV